MLRRTILSSARETVLRLAARIARRPPPPGASLSGLDLRPGPIRPMRSLHPPAAVNDNPLAALEAEIERDLRAKGYLS